MQASTTKIKSQNRGQNKIESNLQESVPKKKEDNKRVNIVTARKLVIVEMIVIRLINSVTDLDKLETLRYLVHLPYLKTLIITFLHIGIRFIELGVVQWNLVFSSLFW